jgi:hypothetical protein
VKDIYTKMKKCAVQAMRDKSILTYRMRTIEEVPRKLVNSKGLTGLLAAKTIHSLQISRSSPIHDRRLLQTS